MPVRRGDGTGIQSIRLGDGTAIQEVRKGDGTVVWSAIPDSEDLHAHYDATALSLSDGDAVSTWGDESGNGHDLTAGTAPTFVADGINGNPGVSFDGADDFLDVVFSTLSRPNHIFVVVKFRSVPSSTTNVIDAETDTDRNVLLQDGNNDWGIYAGSSVKGSNADTNNHVLGALFDGASSNLRIDGTEDLSGDPGSQGLNGLTVGAEVNLNNYSPIDVGEILLYPQDKSSIVSDIEQYLGDKWGIAV